MAHSVASRTVFLRCHQNHVLAHVVKLPLQVVLVNYLDTLSRQPTLYLQFIEGLYPWSEDKFVHVHSKRWLPSLGKTRVPNNLKTTKDVKNMFVYCHASRKKPSHCRLNEIFNDTNTPPQTTLLTHKGKENSTSQGKHKTFIGNTPYA